MANNVFPQDSGTASSLGSSSGDFNAAANFGSQAYAIGQFDFVRQGLGFSSIDFTGLTFNVGSGLASIYDPSSVTEPGTGETRSEGMVYVVEFDGATGVSLTDNDVNEVYLEINPANNNDVSLTVSTTGAPSNPHLKIGQIDTSSNSSRQENRAPDLTAETLDLFRIPGQSRTVLGLFDEVDNEIFQVGLDHSSDDFILRDVNNTIDRMVVDRTTGDTTLTGSLDVGGAVDFDGDLTAKDGEIVWSESNGYIPASSFQYSIDQNLSTSSTPSFQGADFGSNVVNIGIDGGNLTLDSDNSSRVAIIISEGGANKYILRYTNETLEWQANGASRIIEYDHTDNSVRIGGDLRASGNEIIWDEGNGYIPAARFQYSIDQNLQTTNSPTFNTLTLTGDLDVQGGYIKLPTRTSDPASPPVGAMWYRSDLD